MLQTSVPNPRIQKSKRKQILTKYWSGSARSTGWRSWQKSESTRELEIFNAIHLILHSRKYYVDRIPERILINKNYDDGILEYDIALVKINKCAWKKCYKFSSHIRPIALPQSQLCQKQKKIGKRKGKRRKRKRKNKRQKGKRNAWLVGRKALITG